jgi:hypothetical protein
MLGFAYLMPDRWLEVSLHPESPTTGKLDEDLPWFSSVPDKNELTSKFNFALHASYAAIPQ